MDETFDVERDGQAVLAELEEATTRLEKAVLDATVYVYRVRDLPDIQPPPPIFYDVVAALINPKAVHA